MRDATEWTISPYRSQRQSHVSAPIPGPWHLPQRHCYCKGRAGMVPYQPNGPTVVSRAVCRTRTLLQWTGFCGDTCGYQNDDLAAGLNRIAHALQWFSAPISMMYSYLKSKIPKSVKIQGFIVFSCGPDGTTPLHAENSRKRPSYPKLQFFWRLAWASQGTWIPRMFTPAITPCNSQPLLPSPCKTIQL